MLNFTLDYNYFKKINFFFLFIIFFNVFFYLSVENFFLYSFIKESSNYYYYISIIFFLIFFFTINIIIKKNIKNKIYIQISNIYFNKILNTIIILNVFGAFLYFCFRYVPFYLYNLKLNTSFASSDVCILLNLKLFTLVRDSFMSLEYKKLHYYLNFFHPIIVVLLNFFYLLIFILFFFTKSLKTNKKLLIIFSIFSSLLVYTLMTGNKIILVNTYVFFFITALFLYSIGKIKFKKLILISLAFFFFILLIFSIYQVNRTKCLNYLNASNITNQDLSLNKSIYNSQSEFNRNYIYIKDSNYFNSFFRKLVNDNVSLNYSLFYILAGKLSGDYIHNLDLKDKINVGHFIYAKQIYNKFISHLNKLEIVRFEYIKYDNNFLQRKNPVVSLYHSLFRDFGYFNLVFLYTLFLFLFLIFLNKINKINKIKLILYFFWFYIIFYETMTLGFVNLLATYNSIIIFIIFLFFLIFFISISKIKIKYK